MPEEHIVRDQPWHANKLPTRPTREEQIGLLKPRDRTGHVQRLHAFNELRDRISLDQQRLPPVELAPALLFTFGVRRVVLIDCEVSTAVRVITPQLALARDRKRIRSFGI